MLSDPGVTNPENVNDHLPLLPQNLFSSTTDVQGQTTITIYGSDGNSYTVSAIHLQSQPDGTIAFDADVEGWSVAGSFSPDVDNQIRVDYQFQVPLDIYEAPPTRIMLQLVQPTSALPVPITSSATINDLAKTNNLQQFVLVATNAKKKCKCHGGKALCGNKGCDDKVVCGPAGGGVCSWRSGRGGSGVLAPGMLGLLVLLGLSIYEVKRCR